MDRTDICMECQKPIRWSQHGHPQSNWVLFTGTCACVRRSHTTVKAPQIRVAALQ